MRNALEKLSQGSNEELTWLGRDLIGLSQKQVWRQRLKYKWFLWVPSQTTAGNQESEVGKGQPTKAHNQDIYPWGLQELSPLGNL